MDTLDVQHLSGRKWLLLSSYDREGISVPAGFITDLATTPRIFWSIWPPEGDYAKGAVIHDYLYYIKAPRDMADRTYYKIMKDDNVNIATRVIFYRMLRAFGWIKYNNY
jgi:hypothetical protein